MLFIYAFFEEEGEEADIQEVWNPDAHYQSDQLVQGIDVGRMLDKLVKRKAWEAALRSVFQDYSVMRPCLPWQALLCPSKDKEHSVVAG